MDKFLKTAELRDLENQVSKEKISYSRMIELINLKAQKYYNENYKLIPLNENKIPKTKGCNNDCICISCNLLERIFTIKNKKK